MSAELVLINPRRKRRSRKGRMPAGLARYWASHGRRKLRAPKRRKSRRRRAVAVNPRRRRRRALGAYTAGPRRIRRRKLNPRSHARRHVSRRRHRNPRFGLPRFGGIVKGTIVPAAIGATGAIALDVAYGYASPFLPAMLQGKWATLAVKLVGALAIGWGASKVLGRERGRIATLGAVTVVSYGALKSALQTALPTVRGLSGFADFVDYSANQRGDVGAYMPPQGMGFYSPAGVIGSGGVGAYLQPQPGMAGVDCGYNWQNDGM